MWNEASLTYYQTRWVWGPRKRWSQTVGGQKTTRPSLGMRGGQWGKPSFPTFQISLGWPSPAGSVCTLRWNSAFWRWLVSRLNFKPEEFPILPPLSGLIKLSLSKGTIGWMCSYSFSSCSTTSLVFLVQMPGALCLETFIKELQNSCPSQGPGVFRLPETRVRLMSL